jgi:hypothetical protein
LQLYAGKISVARQIAPLEVMPHMTPVSGGLYRQVNVLGRFQFQNGQAPASCDAEQIENAMFAAGVGKDLRVDKACVELCINSRNIFADDRFKPALRLGAIQFVACIGGQRMPVGFEISDQLFAARPRSSPKLFPLFVGSKRNAIIIPLGNGQAPKSQPDFVRRHRRMHADSTWRQGNQATEGTRSLIEQRLRLPLRNDPTVNISGGARFQFFQYFTHRVAFIKFQRQSRV